MNSRRKSKDWPGKHLFYPVVVFFVVVSVLLFALPYGDNKVREIMDGITDEDFIKSVPISEMAVYDLHFETYSRAVMTKEGRLVPMVLTGGLLGEKEFAVLYRGCVNLKYGVDLKDLGEAEPDRITKTGSGIQITLPVPRLIDRPTMITQKGGGCVSELLDTQTPEGFKALFVSEKEKAEAINGLQQLLYEEYERLSPGWASEFGMDGMIRERTRKALKGFLESRIGKAITIRFDDEK